MNTLSNRLADSSILTGLSARCRTAKRSFAFVYLLFCGFVAQSQDPHFSQFFGSPLTLNPALTGKFDGTLRVAGNYRNQWPSVNKAFVTATVSADFNVMQAMLPQGDKWGLGFMAMTDKTANGILTSNYFALSTSYHKALDENGDQQIGVGFQGSYANRLLDGPKLRFMDGLQVDGTFLPSPTESVNLTQVTTQYFDMNAGILYNGTFDGSNSIYIGASVYHLNQPHESFLNASDVVVPTRFTVHGGAFLPFSTSDAGVYLSALYNKQLTAGEFVGGGAVQIGVGTDPAYPVNVLLGSWIRMNNVSDAVIPYVGLDYGNYSVGMTYDVNVSAYKLATQARGGFEISLIYTGRHEERKDRDTRCPRF